MGINKYCVLPGGNVFCWALRAGQFRGRGGGGGLLTTKLLKLSDDHFVAVEIAVQQRQQLTEYCERKEHWRYFIMHH